MIKITQNELILMSQWMESRSGIFLDHSKGYLFESRLQPILQDAGIKSFKELHDRVSREPRGTIARQTMEALLTRETSFFRDRIPFDLLKQHVIPAISARSLSSVPRLKIWCAACSTGQEVYSVAMTLKDMLGDTVLGNVRILGTDISDDAIAYASYGEYSDMEISRGMDPLHLNRHFTKSDKGYRVIDPIRAMVSFGRLNLLSDFTHLGRFDIIFCRNVAIYLKPETRGALFGRLTESLVDEGYLIIGASEMLHGLDGVLKRNILGKAIFYQKIYTPSTRTGWSDL